VIAMSDGQMISTAVLVVGAGAAGLSTAIELGRRGQDVVLVDKGSGQIDHPRTGMISVRTMEFCRRWGIVHEVRNCGFPDDYALDNVFCTSLTGHELARAPFPAMRDAAVPPQSPEGRQRCPQMWFDPILARAASRLPSVSLRYHTRLDDIRQASGGGVLARCRDVRTGESLSVRARYAVACDGAMSTIRDRLGITMSGDPLLNYSVNALFRAPDLLARVGQTPAARFIFVSPAGTTGNITVVNGNDLWRFTMIAGREKPDLTGLDLAGLLRSVIGLDDIEFEILSVTPWRRSQLVADSYRSGPVFLAGDAVHTMSPTGGFGANTGIGDAVDLGWKLDAVLRGWGGEALLDSYESERRPIGIRNSVASTRNFRGWQSAADTARILDDGPAGRQARDTVGAALLESTRPEWHSLGVILGYRYEESPICVPDGSPEPPDDYSEYLPVSRPGSRAPHSWIDEKTSTLDLFGHGFTLVDTVTDASAAQALLAAARQAGVPMRREWLPAKASECYDRRFTLVRPDGHVAWRDNRPPADPSELISVVAGQGTGHG
jgi:2-polyprenyl-6-methoxyphenol hydroxylase-like FAD-dependent oxidoreductase